MSGRDAILLEWPEVSDERPWASTRLLDLPMTVSLVQPSLPAVLRVTGGPSLPLWWPTQAYHRGELVREAWDHLLHLMVGRRRPHAGRHPSYADVLEVATEAVAAGIGDRVLVLAGDCWVQP